MARNCVVTGDVRRSRELEDWPEHLRQLEKVFVAVNERWRDDLLIDFGMRLGDEFQGALKDTVSLYDIVLQIRTEVKVGVYIGIGIGEVEEIPGEEKDMRGSAVYNARDAVEMCKSRKRSIMVKSSESSILDDISNTVLGLIGAIEASWTERQSEIVSLCRLNQNLKGKDLAQRFGITPQAISQHLASANWDMLQESDNLIRRVFRQMYLGQWPEVR